MSSRRLNSFSALLIPLALAAGGVACGGTHHSGPGVSSSEAKDAGGANAATSTDQATLPCNIHTQYPGDSQCITAPDPAKGMQFHYGPSNYDDPNEVAKFILMPGQETTDCVFFMSPNATEVYFTEYHSRLRPGSHHMLLYIQKNTVPEGGPGSCNQLLSRNLFGATSPTMDVKNISGAPENEGLAVRIPASQQVAMQMHVINTTSAPILKEGWANIMYTDISQVKVLGDPIFFIAGTSMNIQVGQTVTNQGTATVPSDAAPDFRLVGAIPHYHGHTTRFTAYKTINGVKEKLLEEYGVLGVPGDPILYAFDSTTMNPTPNPDTMTPGAFSGDVYLKPGDTISWECVQTNDGKGANGVPITNALKFTEQAYQGEMCNLFGIYAPTDGNVWNAFNP
ncbi:MAG TPA: hypothetical protein VKU41_10495 [Polyangiaceae bacterium]|nr:hypothetical protein [Polyangiaceae bacterium]